MVKQIPSVLLSNRGIEMGKIITATIGGAVLLFIVANCAPSAQIKAIASFALIFEIIICGGIAMWVLSKRLPFDPNRPPDRH